MTTPNELTPEEARFLESYRAMDTRRKGELLTFAELQAEAHPAYQPPSLYLIEGDTTANPSKIRYTVPELHLV